jgi:hypothetical protein
VTKEAFENSDKMQFKIWWKFRKENSKSTPTRRPNAKSAKMAHFEDKNNYNISASYFSQPVYGSLLCTHHSKVSVSIRFLYGGKTLPEL